MRSLHADSCAVGHPSACCLERHPLSCWDLLRSWKPSGGKRLRVRPRGLKPRPKVEHTPPCLLLLACPWTAAHWTRTQHSLLWKLLHDQNCQVPQRTAAQLWRPSPLMQRRQVAPSRGQPACQRTAQPFLRLPGRPHPAAPAMA